MNVNFYERCPAAMLRREASSLACCPNRRDTLNMSPTRYMIAVGGAGSLGLPCGCQRHLHHHERDQGR